LNKELRRIYLKLSKLDVCTKVEKNCKCPICSTKEQSENQIKQIGKNIKSCKSATNTKHIIDYIFDKLKNRGIDIQMDSNPYLYCWNNKTYDMKNRKFVNRNKYDYITTTTGYDYEEPTEDYKDEIETLMGNIFSNKEVEKCFFSVCRSGLTGVLEEKFTLANGSGGNGKGLINFGMSLLLGNYFHDVSHSVITKEITDEKPLPAVSKLNGIRYCVISEIKEDSILLEDSIKKLTNPIINARGLYSSQTRIINTATYVAECNARPKIQGENGDAMGRRYIDVYFNKRYTSDPDKLKLDGYLPANPLYKTEDYWKPRRIAFFFWLLNYNETIYEPPIVKARSKEFLNECNIPLTVFEDTIEKCEFDKTRKTIITASEFQDIIRKSEEFKYLEKQEKKLYTKNKIIDFFRNTFFDNYKKKQNIGNSSVSNCIIGYRIKNKELDIEND
jgi:phage/plasmid-associated DNA primase